MRNPQNIPIISRPMQLAHGLLLALSVFCAIWLRGNPLIMYAVCGSILPFILISWLPFKLFPKFFRQLIQLALGALALTWASKQLTVQPADCVLVEVAAILGTALLLGRNSQEHAIMLFISIGFLGYGGMMPGRPLFLPTFLLALLILLVIFYRSRTQAMIPSRTPDPRPATNNPSQGKPLYLYALHLFFAAVVFLIFFKLFPQTKELKNKGLIPVSFNSQQDLKFPKLWKNWYIPPASIVGGKAPNTGKQKDGSSPHLQHDPNAQKINPKDKTPTFDSRQGMGSAFSMGKDLVFRAQSPAKLYWVVQMYDDYDGDTWKCTPSMKSGNNALDRYIPKHEVEVTQVISMDNPQSNKLPYAFRGEKATLHNIAEEDTGAFINYPLKSKLSLQIRGMDIPKPPWVYKVQSFLPAPGLKPDQESREFLQQNNGWNYRRLPDDLISQRLIKLAKEIVKDTRDPYQKAERIKNYLRTHYKYNLQVAAVPPNRELVDFFLFESKEGFCQHFAQAFTVLARLAGLHSRLVTGYAPGNYDVLTNTFEVYEYHAHAWTQIFIPPYGWLTFDGVAPANLNLETTPALLAKMLDPFKDEWKARPPELSYTPPPRMTLNPIKSPIKDSANTLIEKVYSSATQDVIDEPPTAEALGKAATKLAKNSMGKTTESLWDTLKKNMNTLWQKGLQVWRSLQQEIKSLTPLDMTAAVFCLATLLYFWLRRKRYQRLLRFLWDLYACRQAWYSQDQAVLSSKEQVLRCRQLGARMLTLGGFIQPPAKDSLEWGSLIAETDAALGESVIQIASIATAVNFSNSKVTQKQAREVTATTERLFAMLSPYFTQEIGNILHPSKSSHAKKPA